MWGRFRGHFPRWHHCFPASTLQPESLNWFVTYSGLFGGFCSGIVHILSTSMKMCTLIVFDSQNSNLPGAKANNYSQWRRHLWLFKMTAKRCQYHLIFSWILLTKHRINHGQTLAFGVDQLTYAIAKSFPDTLGEISWYWWLTICNRGQNTPDDQ